MFSDNVFKESQIKFNSFVVIVGCKDKRTQPGFCVLQPCKISSFILILSRIEEINWDHNLGTQLQSMGHKLDTVRKMGLVKAILCDNQIYIGGGDPRTGDHAEGLNE
jgi:gamma-glutamyltranspeptidase